MKESGIMMNRSTPKVSIRFIRGFTVCNLLSRLVSTSAVPVAPFESLSCQADNTVVRSTASSGSQVYESTRAVQEYLFMHYGAANIQMPYSFGPTEALKFPQRSAQICIENYISNNPSTGNSKTPNNIKLRALDIGCAVGGASFQLATYFDEVVGIDYSQHFVDAAEKMKLNGVAEVSIQKQGSIFEKIEAKVDEDIDRNRVTFQQGDACNLDFENLGKFDVILASNLLCRLPSPRKFLGSLSSLLNVGGVLILISPYSWLEEYTDKSEWIGGVHVHAGSADVLLNVMARSSPDISFISRFDVPFLIREHERKFQYGVSDCTIWKKTN